MNTQTRTVFYSFRRCPYAMRARMAVCVAGIDAQYIEVSLRNKPQSLLDYSPKGTVPVIVTQSGEVIEESRDIMQWALTKNDPGNWLLHQNADAQQSMAKLIDTCDSQFKPLLDRYKYFDRYPEHTQEYYRQQAEFFLQILETQLQQQAFLMDDSIRLADVAIFPFIRQFSGVDKHWFEASRYKNLQRWLETCVNTHLFETIMKKPGGQEH